jgi:hypothetical protein
LLFPVLLALGVCYIAFTANDRETRILRAQTAAAICERTDVMKALLDQNATTTKVLGDILSSASNPKGGAGTQPPKQP